METQYQAQYQSPDLEAQGKSYLCRHCLLSSKCLRFANREEEVGMQEIPTPPSHANSDTNPALFVSNAQDINHEGKSVVSQAEGATSTSILPHHRILGYSK